MTVDRTGAHTSRGRALPATANAVPLESALLGRERSIGDPPSVGRRTDGPEALRSVGGVPPATAPGAGISHSVLLVHGGADVAAEMAWQLQGYGCRTWPARTGAEAGAALGRIAPHVVILDSVLPEAEAVCRLARTGRTSPAVILLNAAAHGLATELELRADAIIDGPVSPEELIARLRAVVRQQDVDALPVVETPMIGVQPLRVDLRSWEAWREDVPLALTVKEFKLLAYLIDHPNEALSRETLLREVWGWTVGAKETVTVHVRRLRGKVEDDPANPVHIQTVWGVGYRYAPTAG